VKTVGVQEFAFWVPGVISHSVIDVDEVEVVRLAFDFFFDYFVAIADAVDNVPAADAGFDGDVGERYVAKLAAGARYELLKEYKNLFGVTAVPEVVVTGVDNNRIGVKGSDEAVEEPVAGGEGGTAEAEVDGFVVSEIIVEGLPKPDGGTAIKKKFGVVRQFRPFFFQPLDLILVPNHSRGLRGVNIQVRYANVMGCRIDKLKIISVSNYVRFLMSVRRSTRFSTRAEW
jgi:hypothetical protein